MVSAFATEARVVLAQEKVSDKSNEITAIPTLLNLLDVKGHIVTIDAMGCQHAIADLIVSKGGDYIFSLKGNQGLLCEDVELFLNDPRFKNCIFASNMNGQPHMNVNSQPHEGERF